MYQGAQDKQDYFTRVGSHATKPSRRGIIRDIPRWAISEADLELERRLLDEVRQPEPSRLQRSSRIRSPDRKRAVAELRSTLYLVIGRIEIAMKSGQHSPSDIRRMRSQIDWRRGWIARLSKILDRIRVN